MYFRIVLLKYLPLYVSVCTNSVLAKIDTLPIQKLILHLWRMQDNRLQLYNYVFYDVAINGFCQLIKHNQSILESVPNQKVSDVCSLDLY